MELRDEKDCEQDFVDPEIRSYSYEEMKQMLGRNELIIFDTNVWLDLYKYSLDNICEFTNSLERNYYIDEIYVTPKIREEFMSSRMKILNIFQKNILRDKTQITDKYTSFLNYIDDIKDKFKNVIGLSKILENAHQTLEKDLDKINKLNFTDNDEISKKDIEILKLLNKCINNFNNILPKEISPLVNNIWTSDSKKENNALGDLKIWNETIALLNSIEVTKLILVENEKKSEWYDPDGKNPNKLLIQSLENNKTGITFQMCDLKKFLTFNLPVSLHFFFTNTFGLDKLNKYISIENYGELKKIYQIIKNEEKKPKKEKSKELVKMVRETFSFHNKYYGIKNCIIKKVKIINFHYPSSNVKVNVSEYDETRLNYSFVQKYKFMIDFFYKGSSNRKITIIPFYYTLVSDRLFGDDVSDERLEFSMEEFRFYKSYLKKNKLIKVK